jgi:hypothetical protein
MSSADANRGYANTGSPPPVGRRLLRRSISPKTLAAISIPLIVVGVILGIVWARRQDEPPKVEPVQVGPLEDPRVAYTGPYRNVRPEVNYVGDAACIECHRRKAVAYKHHPMGRSMVAIGELANVLPLDAKHNNPFVHDGMTFDIVKEGNRVRHRRRRLDETGKVIYELREEVHYVIGSGARGYSFLSRTDDGFLFQTPISWFSQKQEWGVSPGFESIGFQPRPVHGQCVYCHSNRAHFREGSLNHFEEPTFDGLAIGCERCHGPGELHVAARRRKEPIPASGDFSIVNPEKLNTPALRDAVCQQCHLEGHPRILHRGRKLEEFRPGLPIEAFWSVFVETLQNGEPMAVSQVEQMYQSACFRDEQRRAQKLGKSLGCTTCHDPHAYQEPEERTGYYNARCMECHRDKGCTESMNERNKEADSCIACHLPRRGSSDIPHTAFTDHRIPRRAGQRSSPRNLADVPQFGPAKLGSMLRSFNPGGIEVNPAEASRDLGLAFDYLAESGKAQNQMRLNGHHALTLVDGAFNRAPEDIEIQAARASLRIFVRNDLKGALAEFETILDKWPEWEIALAKAAGIARALGQLDSSISYYRRCVTANPWNPTYRRFLVEQLVKQKDWSGAWPHVQLWVELEPENISARTLSVEILLHRGKKAEAQAEFNSITLLRPANLRELQQRFAEELR